MPKPRDFTEGGKPKLTSAQADDLRDRIAKGIPKSRVARDFGITRETVYQYLKKQG